MSLSIKLITAEGHPPIHRQLVNSIRHAISSGRLRPQDRLPSVRELAITLKVAPNTVARAYRDLEREGLTENIAGRGTFVRDLMPGHGDRKTLETAFDVLRPALLSLTAMGITRAEILNCVKKLLADGPIVLGIVGTTELAARKWSSILQNELSEFWIELVPVTSADLENRESGLEKLANATYVFTLLATYSAARMVLTGAGKQVLPLITELSLSSHKALSELPLDRPIGLICEDLYANSVLEMLGNYCDVSQIRHVNGRDPAETEHLLNQVDLAIHTFGTGDTVAAVNRNGCRLIPLEYYLSRDNLNQIKDIVALHGRRRAKRAA